MTGAATRPRLSSWRALATGLAAALGLATPVQALPQSLTPEAAPPAWSAYAETVTRTVAVWLEEEGEGASGLRSYLDQSRPGADQPTPPLVIRLWIDPRGLVSRIDFPPLADPDADALLRAAVDGRRLPPPPPGMLQPLRLAVQLDPIAPQ
jgi:hypothetical protein